jgi:Na+/H+ antiporter NhaC
LEILFVFAVFFTFFLCWKDYKKKVKKAQGEEEIRKVLMPFLLILFLFILVSIGFIIKLF